MNVFDLLLVGIEVSIALAGFGGIIATNQFQDETTIRRGPVGALTVIVLFSLVPALACTFCLGLSIFGVVGEDLWGTCSVLGAVLYIYFILSIARTMRGAITKKSVWLLFLALQCIGVLIVFANILNVLGIIFHREPGPFMIGIMYGLGVASFMFSRLLLLPLWKVVHIREAENH